MINKKEILNFFDEVKKWYAKNEDKFSKDLSNETMIYFPEIKDFSKLLNAFLAEAKKVNPVFKRWGSEKDNKQIFRIEEDGKSIFQEKRLFLFKDLVDKHRKIRSASTLVQDEISESGKISKFHIESIIKVEERFRKYLQMLEDIKNPDNVDINLDRRGFESKGFPETVYTKFLVPYKKAKMKKNLAMITLDQIGIEEALLSNELLKKIFNDVPEGSSWIRFEKDLKNTFEKWGE